MNNFICYNCSNTNPDLCKCKSKDLFIERVYEIAFGDNAINRKFTTYEVLQELRKFSDLALKNEVEN